MKNRTHPPNLVTRFLIGLFFIFGITGGAFALSIPVSSDNSAPASTAGPAVIENTNVTINSITDNLVNDTDHALAVISTGGSTDPANGSLNTANTVANQPARAFSNAPPATDTASIITGYLTPGALSTTAKEGGGAQAQLT